MSPSPNRIRLLIFIPDRSEKIGFAEKIQAGNDPDTNLRWLILNQERLD